LSHCSKIILRNKEGEFSIYFGFYDLIQRVLSSEIYIDVKGILKLFEGSGGKNLGR
jgi:hypothetical protein